MTSLQVEIRHETGKGVARKLRAAGKLPAVVYGPKSESISIACDPNALIEIFDESQNRNTLVTLDLETGPVQCLVREVKRHPLSRVIEHVDFIRVEAGVEVQVVVPVVTEGRPAGATLGGRLRLVRRTILAACLPKDIPDALVIDVSPMHIGDIVLASAIPLPKGVRLLIDPSIQVLTCYGKGKAGAAASDAAAEAPEAEEEAAEAAAEGDEA